MIFLLAALAGWRICHFIAEEEGPGGFMFDIRYALRDTFFSALVQCVPCNSVWVSLILTPFCFHKMQFLYWLSLSATIMFIEVLYVLLRKESA